MKLNHILQSTNAVDIDLGRYRVDEMKRAARFWIGKEAVSFTKRLRKNNSAVWDDQLGQIV